jgi:hypothetical protein
MITVTATANVMATAAELRFHERCGGRGGLYRIPRRRSELMWQCATIHRCPSPRDRRSASLGSNRRPGLPREPDQTSGLLLSEADQVTAVGSGGSGETYLATRTPRLYRLNRGRRTEGTTAPRHRHQDRLPWGKIRWQATTPRGPRFGFRPAPALGEPDNTGATGRSPTRRL